jgi:hypothetical protein
MMTRFVTYRAKLSIQNYALTNMIFHINLSGLIPLPCPIAINTYLQWASNSFAKFTYVIYQVDSSPHYNWYKVNIFAKEGRDNSKF